MHIQIRGYGFYLGKVTVILLLVGVCVCVFTYYILYIFFSENNLNISGFLVMDMEML